MFSLPQNPDERCVVEGTIDQRPIVLFGDTAEQFRALVWIIYALCVETLSMINRFTGA